MINEAEVRQYLEFMEKKKLQNLLGALKIDQSLEKKFGDKVTTKYSAETDMLIVICKEGVLHLVRDVVDAIVKAIPENPKRPANASTIGETRRHLKYLSGLSVMVTTRADIMLKKAKIIPEE